MQKAQWLSEGPHPTLKLLYGTIKRFSILPSSSITDDAILPSRAKKLRKQEIFYKKEEAEYCMVKLHAH